MDRLWDLVKVRRVLLSKKGFRFLILNLIVVLERLILLLVIEPLCFDHASVLLAVSSVVDSVGDAAHTSPVLFVVDSVGVMVEYMPKLHRLGLVTLTIGFNSKKRESMRVRALY